MRRHARRPPAHPPARASSPAPALHTSVAAAACASWVQQRSPTQPAPRLHSVRLLSLILTHSLSLGAPRPAAPLRRRRYSYNLVLHKHGERLYTGAFETVAAHLQAERARIVAQPDELLLASLRQLYERHTLNMQKIKDVLMYMVRGASPIRLLSLPLPASAARGVCWRSLRAAFRTLARAPPPRPLRARFLAPPPPLLAHRHPAGPLVRAAAAQGADL